MSTLTGLPHLRATFDMSVRGARSVGIACVDVPPPPLQPTLMSFIARGSVINRNEV
jgi:hypothetical protein